MLNQSLSKAVSELMNNWLKIVNREEITSVCRSHGLSWRQRLLDPVTTIELLLLQVLYGNTAITSLRYFTRRGFSAAAYCQARIRVPVGVLKSLLKKMTSSISDSAEGTWYGRRLLLADGSNFSMPDVASLVEHFGKPTGQKAGCGFPVAHFLALMHGGTGLIQAILPGELFSSDLSSFIKLHSDLKQRDVVVADRAFGSYANIALLIAAGVDAVFRVHHRRKIDFCARSKKSRNNTKHSNWKKKLGKNDQLAKWRKPKVSSDWMTPEQYQSLIVYNLICTVMINAAESQGCDVQRISFVDAMRWLRHSCSNTCFLQILTVPLRPNRREPRAIKRRPKTYDLLIKPRKTYQMEFLNA